MNPALSCAVLSVTLLLPIGPRGCSHGHWAGSHAVLHGSGGSETTVAKVAKGLPPQGGLPLPRGAAAPSVDSIRSPSGLASKVLVAGTGSVHPGQNDTVKVSYTVWTADGKMVESTVAPSPGRPPQPAALPLARTIPGLSEGVQLMVVGEKRRLWIPPQLRHAASSGAPEQTLIFDIELLEITPGPKPPEDVAAPPADAETTGDGLASKVQQPGTGKDHPGPNDGVRVEYSIWDRGGKLLDESKERPAVLPVTGLSDGWAEGIQLMVVGEKRTLWVPAALANPHRPGPPPSDITIVVELVDILPGPKTPPDVKAPPRDATVEKDGLATKVLAKGTGKTHPAQTSSVTLNYAGWTTDGKMFESTSASGEPARLQLGSLVPGLAEAIELMVEGEKRRIWIPKPLANGGRPQHPRGMLVFEVELLKFGGGLAPDWGPPLSGSSTAPRPRTPGSASPPFPHGPMTPPSAGGVQMAPPPPRH